MSRATQSSEGRAKEETRAIVLRTKALALMLLLLLEVGDGDFFIIFLPVCMWYKGHRSKALALMLLLLLEVGDGDFFISFLNVPVIMDPFSFLARVLALHHPIVDTPPSDSPTSTRERSNVLQQQRSHSQHHPSPSSTIATAAYAAVLKLASELLSQEPGLLEGAVEALDRAPVHRITTRQYRRELHLVKGRERLEYTVLGTRDCSCQSFQLMQCRSLRPRCKHLLAVCLAPFLGRLEEREVNDELYESYVRL